MTQHYELVQINWGAEDRDALAEVVSREGLDINLIASVGFTCDTYRKFSRNAKGEFDMGATGLHLYTREPWPSPAIFEYLKTLDNVLEIPDYDEENVA